MTEENKDKQNIENQENKIQEKNEYSLVKNSVGRKQRERKLRKRRKKLKTLKALLKFCICLLLLYSFYRFYNLSGWYLPQNTFTNPTGERIEIINNSVVPTNVIRDSIKNIPINHTPMFLMSTGKIQKEIYKIPVIRDLYVRRYAFPARIQIIVNERIPIAIIKRDINSRPAAFYTADDKLITNSEFFGFIKSSNLPRIITKETDLSKYLTKKKIKELMDIISNVETYSNSKVEYIDLRNQNDVYVKVKNANIRLGSLDSTIYERIKRLYILLPQQKSINSPIKYVDISWDKVNYFKIEKKAK